MPACVAAIFCLEKENNQKEQMFESSASAYVWLWYKTAFSGIVWEFVIKCSWNGRKMMECSTQVGLVAVKDNKSHITTDSTSPHRRGAVYLTVYLTVYFTNKSLTFLQDVS